MERHGMVHYRWESTPTSGWENLKVQRIFWPKDSFHRHLFQLASWHSNQIRHPIYMALRQKGHAIRWKRRCAMGEIQISSTWRTDQKVQAAVLKTASPRAPSHLLSKDSSLARVSTQEFHQGENKILLVHPSHVMAPSARTVKALSLSTTFHKSRKHNIQNFKFKILVAFLSFDTPKIAKFKISKQMKAYIIQDWWFMSRLARLL